eukprot:SAG31_NODE_13189_length_887_cov_0.680203_1_plen_31_part_10
MFTAEDTDNGPAAWPKAVCHGVLQLHSPGPF